MPATENVRNTVIRFDKSCTIQLTIVDDLKVNIVMYNDIEGTVKKASCKLKGEQK